MLQNQLSLLDIWYLDIIAISPSLVLLELRTSQAKLHWGLFATGLLCGYLAHSSLGAVLEAWRCTAHVVFRGWQIWCEELVYSNYRFWENAFVIAVNSKPPKIAHYSNMLKPMLSLNVPFKHFIDVMSRPVMQTTTTTVTVTVTVTTTTTTATPTATATATTTATTTTATTTTTRRTITRTRKNNKKKNNMHMLVEYAHVFRG